MPDAGERFPRGDGMALAHLLGKERTSESIDEDSEPLIQQFKRCEGTPRRDHRSSTANDQVRVPPTFSASEAATDRRGIQLLAESSSARDFVQQAAATGTTTDVLWEPNPETVAATVQSVAEMLQRTAAEDARP